jgi:hypothetical protein
MDDELRLLEHELKTSSKDVALLVRYARLLARHGVEPAPDLNESVQRVRAAMAHRPEHVGIERGDEVWVEEQKTNNWVDGRWRGIVTEVLLQPTPVGGAFYLQFRVRPLFPDEEDLDAEPIPFRKAPLPEQRVRGLILDRDDHLELVAKKTGST